MKATMIVAALLSTVSALPANNGTTGTPEITNIDNEGINHVANEVKDLTAKASASIQLVKEGNAKVEDVMPAIKENFGQLGSALAGLNRVEGVSAMYGATKGGAGGKKGGLGGGKGGLNPFYTEGDFAFDIEQFGDGIFSLGDIIGALLNLIVDVVDVDGIVEGAADAVTELLNDVADEPDVNNNLLPLRAGATPKFGPATLDGQAGKGGMGAGSKGAIAGAVGGKPVIGQS